MCEEGGGRFPFSFEQKTLSGFAVPEAEESVCISGALLRDDAQPSTFAHLPQFVDCFLGSSETGGGTHLETEV